MRLRNKLRVAALIALVLGGSLSVPVAHAAAVCNGLAATIEGNDAAEELNGTPNADVIAAKGGDDIVAGFAGNDVICGGDGNDILLGMDGEDWLLGENGDVDAMEGGAGSDTVVGGPGSLDIATYASATIGVQASLQSGSGSGGAAGDTYSSVEGLIGSPNPDTLTGDAGINVVGGGGGNDTLNGGASSDYAIFQTATGVVANLSTSKATGEGTDSLAQLEGLIGTSARDTLTGSAGANYLAGSDGNDTINGLAGPDDLSGGNGDDVLSGADGDDKLSGNLGTDKLMGGGGLWIDTASYAGAIGPVNASLASKTASGSDGTDSISGVEAITGSAYNDTLTGNGGANTLRGGRGDDQGIGKAGDDYLDGEDGIDKMTGGLGKDECFAETMVTCESAQPPAASGIASLRAATEVIAKPQGLPPSQGASTESYSTLFFSAQDQLCLTSSAGDHTLTITPPRIDISGTFGHQVWWRVQLWRWNGGWVNFSDEWYSRVAIGADLAINGPGWYSAIAAGVPQIWTKYSDPSVKGAGFVNEVPAGYYMVTQYGSDGSAATPWLRSAHKTAYLSGTAPTLTEPTRSYCRVYE